MIKYKLAQSSWYIRRMWLRTRIWTQTQHDMDTALENPLIWIQHGHNQPPWDAGNFM